MGVCCIFCPEGYCGRQYQKLPWSPKGLHLWAFLDQLGGLPFKSGSTSRTSPSWNCAGCDWWLQWIASCCLKSVSFSFSFEDKTVLFQDSWEKDHGEDATHCYLWVTEKGRMSQLCACHFMLSNVVGHILGRQIRGCHSEVPKSAWFVHKERRTNELCVLFLKAGPPGQLRTQWSMLW